MWILYAFGSAFFAGITAILVLKNKLIVEMVIYIGGIL